MVSLLLPCIHWSMYSCQNQLLKPIFFCIASPENANVDVSVVCVANTHINGIDLDTFCKAVSVNWCHNVSMLSTLLKTEFGLHAVLSEEIFHSVVGMFWSVSLLSWLVCCNSSTVNLLESHHTQACAPDQGWLFPHLFILDLYASLVVDTSYFTSIFVYITRHWCCRWTWSQVRCWL